MIFSSPDPAADPYVARIVLALQHASIAVEARLIGDDRLPPLQEDEHALTAWRGRWMMAWDGVDLLGAVAWSEHADHLEIVKVMVDPLAMRRGVASGLLARVLDDPARRPVLVATGRDNAPGVAMYVKHGFEPVADELVPPGIWVTRLRRDPPSD